MVYVRPTYKIGDIVTIKPRSSRTIYCEGIIYSVESNEAGDTWTYMVDCGDHGRLTGITTANIQEKLA